MKENGQIQEQNEMDRCLLVVFFLFSRQNDHYLLLDSFGSRFAVCVAMPLGTEIENDFKRNGTHEEKKMPRR